METLGRVVGMLLEVTGEGPEPWGRATGGGRSCAGC